MLLPRLRRVAQAQPTFPRKGGHNLIRFLYGATKNVPGLSSNVLAQII